MPGVAAQSTVSKPSGGVLPISAISSQQASGADNKAHAKGSPQKLKVVVRRLPPGLTRSEFEDALGDEWKTGQGKISWALYKPGKIARDLSKPSKPARAYFQVTQQSHLESLSDKVRQTSFLDAKNTANDALLLGPPTLEFAQYSRVPSSKKRNDVRQGLIDQDPEFIAFLESLTNPAPKASAVDGLESGQQKENALKVTPLIQYLRDKKAAKEAAKEKEKAAAKSGKQHNRQSSKSETTTTSVNGKPAKESAKASAEVSEKKGTRSAKQEKVTKQTTKQTKKDQPAAESKSPARVAPAAPAETVKSSETPSKRPEKSPSATAAARMIQRDLGIRGRGGSRGRGGRQAAEASQAIPSSKENEQPSPQPSPQTNGKPTTATSSKQPKSPPPPKPSILKRDATEKTIAPETTPQTTTADQPSPTAKQSRAAPTPASTTPTLTAPKPKPAKAPPTISPNATHAFLKHANPSQGITEPLIMTALSAFGEISRVEIDKRKGFAYVDFVDSGGLQRAVNASPVKVAQGSVQVLERKERVMVAPAVRDGGSAAGAQERGSAAAVAAAGGTAVAVAGGGATPPSGPRNAGTSGPSASAFRGGRGRGRGGSMRGGAIANTNANTSVTAGLTASVSPVVKSPIPATVTTAQPVAPLQSQDSIAPLEATGSTTAVSDPAPTLAPAPTPTPAPASAPAPAAALEPATSIPEPPSDRT